MKEDELIIANLWFQANGSITIKLPKEITEKELPINLEKRLAVVFKHKEKCMEIRNLMAK